MSGKDNIALNKPASANHYIEPYKPENAVMNTEQVADRWLCGVLPGWLTVDLQEPFWINHWMVVPLPSYDNWPSAYSTQSVELRGSVDNPEPTEVLDQGNTFVDKLLPAPKKVRFAQLYFTEGIMANPNLTSIYQFLLYEADNPPYLSSIMAEGEALTPKFSAKHYSYTIDVPNTKSSIRILPTAMSNQLTIKVNNQVVVSGQYSPTIALHEGDNIITVEVSSPGGMVDRYFIHVEREGKTTSPHLVSLNLTGPRSTQINITPAFSKDHYAYQASVPHNFQTVQVTAVSENSSDTLYINGQLNQSGIPTNPINLAVGVNELTIRVVRGNEEIVYTVEVTRQGA